MVILENAGFLFYKSKFNGDISKWNIANLKNSNAMFAYSNFNEDINQWDIKNVKDIENIFEDSKPRKIPYWAEIEAQEKRIKAYDDYHLNNQLNIELNNKEKYKTKKLIF